MWVDELIAGDPRVTPLSAWRLLRRAGARRRVAQHWGGVDPNEDKPPAAT